MGSFVGERQIAGDSPAQGKPTQREGTTAARLEPPPSSEVHFAKGIQLKDKEDTREIGTILRKAYLSFHFA